MPNLRALTSVAIGAMLALPLAGVANASTPSVTFTGKPLLNLGTLSCPSTPDVTHLTVTAGSAVTFVNHTGKPAVLHVGSFQEDVPDQAATEVTVQQSATAEMDPSCAPDVATHTPVTIDVAPTSTVHTTAPMAPAGAKPLTVHTIGHVVAGSRPGGTPVTGAAKTQPAKPTAGAAVPAQVIGRKPGDSATKPLQLFNRGLLELLLAVVVIASAVVIGQLARLQIRLNSIRHGGGHGGGGRGARDVPEGQAAQIFQLAQRIKQREMERNSNSG